METSIYEITFPNGSKFKVFCANRSQKNRFGKTISQMRQNKIQFDFKEFTNGITLIKEWEKTLEITKLI